MNGGCGCRTRTVVVAMVLAIISFIGGPAAPKTHSAAVPMVLATTCRLGGTCTSRQVCGPSHHSFDVLR
jgi:hypothetical protein